MNKTLFPLIIKAMANMDGKNYNYADALIIVNRFGWQIYSSNNFYLEWVPLILISGTYYYYKNAILQYDRQDCLLAKPVSSNTRNAWIKESEDINRERYIAMW